MPRNPPTVTLALAASLLAVWVWMAWRLGDPLTASHTAAEMARLGAPVGGRITLASGWRLVACQWLHVKAMHMALNVACLLGLGALLEPRLGGLRFLAVWLIAGTVGVAASAALEAGLGLSGASQAVAGLAGLALVRWGRERPHPPALAIVAVAVLAVIIGIDLVFAGAPKPGHLAGLLAGAALGLPPRAR